MSNISTSIAPETETIVLHRPVETGEEARVHLTINHRTRRASVVPWIKRRDGEFHSATQFMFVNGTRLDLWMELGRLIAEASELAKRKLTDAVTTATT